MNLGRPVVGGLAATLCLTAAAPAADAGRIEVRDRAGDTYSGSDLLDIRTVVVRNLERGIVTKVYVGRAGRGDLIVHFQSDSEPDRALAGVVSHHRPRHGDLNTFETLEGVETCDGLRVVWDHEKDLATVKLPSTCFADGEYDAVRVRVLTELVVDQDLYDPNPSDGQSWPWTRWAERG